MYIVAEGEVEIQVRPYGHTASAPRQTIATLRRGQNFGEVALLDQGRRTAAAQAVQPNTLLIVVPSDKITLMCENVPRLGYALMRNIAADLAMKIRSTDIEMQARLWLPHSHS
jgi:CRP-like cAMP-binding protein